MTIFSDPAVLRHLAGRTHVTAAEWCERVSSYAPAGAGDATSN